MKAIDVLHYVSPSDKGYVRKKASAWFFRARTVSVGIVINSSAQIGEQAGERTFELILDLTALTQRRETCNDIMRGLLGLDSEHY